MQFIDLSAQYQRIAPQVQERMNEVLNNGRYIMGPMVGELEQRLADYVGRKYCVTCSNGTDGLILPLLAMGVQKGDAVFVPDFTFFASAEAVSAVGATPVFVDILPDTYNMDPNHLEAMITRTLNEGNLTPKGIIPVDLFGQPADYDAIGKIAEKYNLFVLEDGAQGFGGTIGDKKACSFGDVASTSFFPAKPLGCYGDGGAMFTDSEEIRDLLVSLRVHGSNPADKYDNIRIGRNCRLDTLQAAVLHCKLDIFPDEVEKRHWVADQYNKRLSGAVITPALAHGFTSSYAQYTIRLESEEQRNKVMAHMKEAGIPTVVYYPKPMHAQTAFAGMANAEDYPVAEAACKRVMSLPMHPYLDEETIDTICNALLTALEK
jgi:dTDP-4-amino-4,6-dideoxygalactose transaminase